MYKSSIALIGLTLAAFGWQQSTSSPYLQLKEEAMTIEYTPGVGQAALVIEAENEEGFEQIEVCTPDGEPLFRLRAEEGKPLSLQGYVVETHEESLSELLATWVEGAYDIRGRTVGGQRVTGSASLTHDLLRQPVVLYPQPDTDDLPTDLMIAWIPDPEAQGYRVGLEQGETDTMVANVPAGQSFFHVPYGVLDSGRLTQVEIGVIGPNGNMTMTEVEFVTR